MQRCQHRSKLRPSCKISPIPVQKSKAYTGYLEEQICRYESNWSLLPRFDTRVRDKSYTIGKFSETPTNSISFKSGAGVEPPPNGSGTLLCGKTLADGDVARLKKQSVKERDEQIMRLKEVCLSLFLPLCVPSLVVCLFIELLQCCCSLCSASERTGMQELARRTQENGQFTPFPRAAGFTPTDARPNAPGERSLDFGKTVV